MIKDVQYPKHLYKGIVPLLKSFPLPKNLRVFGGDTETVRGNPDSFQISASPEDEIFSWCDSGSIWPDFWGWTRSRARRKGVNLMYLHHLNFDLRVLFKMQHVPMYEQFNDIRLNIGRVKIKMLFGKVNKADIYDGDIHVQLLDSMAFTQAGLARSADMYKLPLKKMERPKGIGQRRIDTPYFKEYSMQDARVVRGLGLKIMEFHKMYEVRPSITLPDYSSKVFRRHFIQPSESIPFPPEEVVRAAELSYHGGKNGYYLNGPEVLEDVFEVDISSAYPYAMVELPPMTEGEYVRVAEEIDGYAGIYKISGRTDSYLYPMIYDHAFNIIPPNTDFKNIWITSYELENVRRFTSTRIDDLMGYLWFPGKTAMNPFLRYVRHFYDKKQATPKDNPNYHFFKIMLNSLYGKTVSTIEQKSLESKNEVKRQQEAGVPIKPGFRIDERYDPVLKSFITIKKDWQAGSMYNAFVATLITGHCRAYITRLEVETDAIHTATDSVKSLVPYPERPGLGGLKTETFGRCYIFRNKLYLHCARDYVYCGHKEPPYRFPEGHPREGNPLIDTDGQHLCKVAMHGFKGRVWELWESRHKIISKREFAYGYTHVVGLREGLRRGETPCDFVKRKEILKL